MKTFPLKLGTNSHIPIISKNSNQQLWPILFHPSPTSLPFHSRLFWNKSKILYHVIHFSIYFTDKNSFFKNITVIILRAKIFLYHQITIFLIVSLVLFMFFLFVCLNQVPNKVCSWQLSLLIYSFFLHLSSSAEFSPDCILLIAISVLFNNFMCPLYCL